MSKMKRLLEEMLEQHKCSNCDRNTDVNYDLCVFCSPETDDL